MFVDSWIILSSLSGLKLNFTLFKKIEIEKAEALIIQNVMVFSFVKQEI